MVLSCGLVNITYFKCYIYCWTRRDCLVSSACLAFLWKQPVVEELQMMGYELHYKGKTDVWEDIRML